MNTYYIAYSYIELFLSQVTNLSNNTIPLVLSLFGVAGIGGSIYNKNKKKIHLSFIILSYTCFILIKTKRSILDHTIIDMYSMRYKFCCDIIFSSIFGLKSIIEGQTMNLLNIQSIGYIVGIIVVLNIIFYIIAANM